MSSDFTALLLQGAGGGIAATATSRSAGNAGRYIMIAGLSSQVLSLLVFMVLCLEFYLRLRSVPRSMKVNFGDLTSSRRFKMFANYGESFVHAIFQAPLTAPSPLVRNGPDPHTLSLPHRRVTGRISRADCQQRGRLYGPRRADDNHGHSGADRPSPWIRIPGELAVNKLVVPREEIGLSVDLSGRVWRSVSLIN
jgi:hypothetical protein